MASAAVNGKPPPGRSCKGAESGGNECKRLTCVLSHTYDSGGARRELKGRVLFACVTTNISLQKAEVPLCEVTLTLDLG
ncbi:hypothetical protein NQZ68_039991 [Dissostichus eleginoides]|nr:hypothetical protein NQZ68_039991 [Dissostichus eleginoides]